MATILELINQAESDERVNKAKMAGFIVALPGELYTLSVSRHSHVYIELVLGQWLAWRETYLDRKKKAVYLKEIASGESFEYVLMKTKRYFTNLKRNISFQK
jgi:hypothetical protein